MPNSTARGGTVVTGADDSNGGVGGAQMIEGHELRTLVDLLGLGM